MKKCVFILIPILFTIGCYKSDENNTSPDVTLEMGNESEEIDDTNIVNDTFVQESENFVFAEKKESHFNLYFLASSKNIKTNMISGICKVISTDEKNNIVDSVVFKSSSSFTPFIFSDRYIIFSFFKVDSMIRQIIVFSMESKTLLPIDTAVNYITFELLDGKNLYVFNEYSDNSFSRIDLETGETFFYNGYFVNHSFYREGDNIYLKNDSSGEIYLVTEDSFIEVDDKPIITKDHLPSFSSLKVENPYSLLDVLNKN